MKKAYLWIVGLFVLTMLLGVGELFADATKGKAVDVIPIVDFLSAYTSMSYYIGWGIIWVLRIVLSVWAIKVIYVNIKDIMSRD